MQRREIKYQALLLTLLYYGRSARSSNRRCSIKKLFLKILQYPHETLVLESLFKKVTGLNACNFIKKRPQRRCFPVNIAKFLILPILKNFCKWLLFDCFKGSLLHGSKGLKIQGLDCMTAQASGSKSQVQFFLFKLTYFVLNRFPTCVCKPKTNTFHESIKFLHWLFLESFQMVSGSFRWFQVV